MNTPSTPSSLSASAPSDAAARLSRLQTYLAGDPNNLTLLAELSDLALGLGAVPEALEFTGRHLALTPTDGRSQYRRGMALLFAGQAQEALALFKPLLLLNTDTLAVRLALARAAAMLGDWALAAETLAPLYQNPSAAPHLSSVDLTYVRALHYQGQVEEAIQSAQSILAQRPQAALRAALGTLLLDGERLEEAAALLAEHPAEAEASAEMAAVQGYVALSAGATDQAAQSFEASLSLGTNGRAALGLGLVQAVIGQVAAAQETLAQAVALMPQHLGTRHALAWLQMLTHQWEAARRTFEGAMAADRTFGDNHGGLALMALHDGQMELAAQHARAGLKLDPNSLNSGFALALIRSGQALDFSSEASLKLGLQLLQTKYVSGDQQRAQMLERIALAAQLPRSSI